MCFFLFSFFFFGTQSKVRPLLFFLFFFFCFFFVCVFVFVCMQYIYIKKIHIFPLLHSARVEQQRRGCVRRSRPRAADHQRVRFASSVRWVEIIKRKELIEILCAC